MSIKDKKAFTLIELLVVIAVIAMLMGILMPSLTAAKTLAKAVVCQSNMRQLLLANSGYSVENNGFYVPAAKDMYSGGNNFHRWHGVRESINDPFDSLKGPLVGYLGDGKVKKCPQKTNFRQGSPWNFNYEDGAGGYGYNKTYIGSRIWQSSISANYEKTTKSNEIRQPAETLMFSDAAMSELNAGVPYYLEYSFAEPTFNSLGFASPSIHFRHKDKANIGWVDGHIDQQKMTPYGGLNAYGVKSADMMLGWFGALNNSKFDLK